MGREVKRVPLDFDYPLGKVWYGYQIGFCNSEYTEGCERCREFARVMGIPMKEYSTGDACPKFREHFKIDPPTGEGFQLWETTSEGSPSSPVFKTAKELADWCEKNATVFADIKASAADWMKMIQEQCFHVRMGNAIFL